MAELTRAGSATYESGKFPPKSLIFQFFSLWVKKNLIGLGQKIPGSRVGQPLIYCRSKVCSSQGPPLIFFKTTIIWFCKDSSDVDAQSTPFKSQVIAHNLTVTEDYFNPDCGCRFFFLQSRLKNYFHGRELIPQSQSSVLSQVSLTSMSW